MRQLDDKTLHFRTFRAIVDVRDRMVELYPIEFIIAVNPPSNVIAALDRIEPQIFVEVIERDISVEREHPIQMVFRLKHFPDG